MNLEIIPIEISKEVEENDDLVELMLNSNTRCTIKDHDIVIFTQKIISKQEGQTIKLSSINASLLATGIASEYKKDPRIIQLILDQSKRIVRMNNGIIVSETNSGLVCANAGVDESNVQEDCVTLLPKDADKSAERLRSQIKAKTGRDVAVIISDTFGRPFRIGQTNVAIGISGIPVISNYVGKKDSFGRVLRVTEIAIVDEICSAAELVMGKSLRIPIAIVRNYNFDVKNDTIKNIIRAKTGDLFR